MIQYRKEQNKSDYMKEVWEELATIDYRTINVQGVTKFKTFTVVSYKDEATMAIINQDKGETEDEHEQDRL